MVILFVIKTFFMKTFLIYVTEARGTCKGISFENACSLSRASSYSKNIS